MILAKLILFGLFSYIYISFLIGDYRKRGWLKAGILAFVTSLYLFLFVLLFLWLGVYEFWIIRTGLSLSFLFGVVIWAIPYISPDLASRLHIK
jgi:hypothetical protein